MLKVAASEEETTELAEIITWWSERRQGIIIAMVLATAGYPIDYIL